MRRRLKFRGGEGGVTLVELMVSMTIGLFVVAVAASLFISVKTSYVAGDEAARIDEQGRFVLELMARAIRQAAYENWDDDDAPFSMAETLSANIAGIDVATLKETSPGIDNPSKSTVNGSDVLSVRYFGSGKGENGDGTVINCAGFGVAAPASASAAESERGWSIFYVGIDAAGEPELRCKYMGRTSWAADAVVRGVESFQVIYGLDTDGDGLPNCFVNATTINALDAALPVSGASNAEKQLDLNRKTFWKKVVAIRLAVLMRGSQPGRDDALQARYDLFGSGYSGAVGGADAGTAIKEKDLPSKTRNRMRKIFSTVVQLRNRHDGGAS